MSFQTTFSSAALNKVPGAAQIRIETVVIWLPWQLWKTNTELLSPPTHTHTRSCVFWATVAGPPPPTSGPGSPAATSGSAHAAVSFCGLHFLPGTVGVSEQRPSNRSELDGTLHGRGRRADGRRRLQTGFSLQIRSRPRPSDATATARTNARRKL